MNKKIIEEVSKIVNEYIVFMYNYNTETQIIENGKIEQVMSKLLNYKNEKYDIINNDLKEKNKSKIAEFQNKLSKINEISSSRKINGVYYTPKDVTEYMVINLFIHSIYKDDKEMYNMSEGYEKLNEICERELKELVFDRSIFDPTCGTGEFLITAFEIKVKLLENRNIIITNEDYIKISKTLFGNDIDSDSTDITKLRIFIKLSEYVPFVEMNHMSSKLIKNFYNEDFVLNSNNIKKRFHYIVGNPPYVEYSKLTIKPQNKFGNIYADILKNSIEILKDNGSYSFVVPISYVSTPRMRRIRNYVSSNINKEIVLNFGDRPDSLFNGAHQKLSIIFGLNNDEDYHEVLSSSYIHWYNSERSSLFNRISIESIDNNFEGFYPKIGNALQHNIFNKLYDNDGVTLFDILTNKELETYSEIYLNMRATFFIKAFSHNPGSKEYKKYKIDSQYKGLILTLLNSSIFFFYWTVVSDCWHITQKELKNIKIPITNIDFIIFNNLMRELEDRLETTKVYVNSVQTDYEYKHKESIEIIDRIDNELAKLFLLNTDEINEIKQFSRKYRLGLDDGKNN